MDLCPLCAGKKPSAVVAAEFLLLLRLVLPFIQKWAPGYLLVLPSSKFECVFKLPSPPCRTVPCFGILGSKNCTAEYVFFLQVLVK